MSEEFEVDKIAKKKNKELERARAVNKGLLPSKAKKKKKT